MTKEEAKAKLEDVAKNLLWGCGEYSEALDMAIKVLELEPCSNCITFKRYAKQIGFEIEQEPCDDCVSRAELLKAIDTWDKFGCDADTKLVPYKDHYIPYIHYDDVIKCIKGMPSVNQEPKTGHWISDGYKTEADWIRGRETYKCSSCGREITKSYELKDDVYKDYPYCHCGAKMESEG